MTQHNPQPNPTCDPAHINRVLQRPISAVGQMGRGCRVPSKRSPRHIVGQLRSREQKEPLRSIATVLRRTCPRGTQTNVEAAKTRGRRMPYLRLKRQRQPWCAIYNCSGYCRSATRHLGVLLSISSPPHRRSTSCIFFLTHTDRDRCARPWECFAEIQVQGRQDRLLALSENTCRRLSAPPPFLQ